MRILGCDQIYEYYELFPLLPSITEKLKYEFENPGLHNNFHDEERCELFNEDKLKFEPLGACPLPQISLTKYTINDYQKLVILRHGELSTEVNLAWSRFLYLYLLECNHRFIYYDPDKNILAFPSRMSLPWPVDKILYLATGRLPSKIQMSLIENELVLSNTGSFYTIYRGLFFNTAGAILKNLGQELTKQNHININIY